MDKYAAYTLRDFVQDESFVRWVKYPDAAGTAFWTGVRQTYPQQAATMDKARELVAGLAAFYPEVPDAEIEKGWRALQERTVPARPYRLPPLRRYWSVAASVLLLALAGWWLLRPRESFFSPGQLPANRNEAAVYFENQGDTTRRIPLNDGSEVTLSSHSTIRWVAGNDRREIHLEGEAFFDVTKDSTRPFFVVTPRLITKVLGTRFKVTAYPNRQVKVEVNSGRVQVFHSGPDAHRNGTNGIILHPNQQVVYSEHDPKPVRSLIQTPKILIPEEQLRSFVYTDTPIAKVFEGLEEVYGIRIVYDEKKFRNCKLNMALSNESLYETLELIGKMVEARYNIIDGEVIFIGEGCN